MYNDLYDINNNGLKTPTLSELITYLENVFKSIYGDNINLEQNTPDGQLINILAQNLADINEVLTYWFNSVDPNVAEGRNLDRIVAYHNIKRKAGSYTQVPIIITANQQLSLQGLDNNYTDVNGTGFTVADSFGNQFILVQSATLQEGENTLIFRASEIGEVEPILNSITNILTPQLGVISANNPSAPLQIGVQEESDYNLRNRFFLTPAIQGTGELDNIVANLLNLDGVLSVYADENKQDTTNQYGTPPHSIWVIVNGGNNDEIANVIYSIISAGCGMKGNIVVPITNVFGNQEPIRFDRPSTENLYINFTITKRSADITYNINTIKENLINNLKLTINDTITSNDITCLLKSLNDTLIYTDVELSNNGTTFTNMVSNTNINYIFTLTADNINITEQ